VASERSGGLQYIAKHKGIPSWLEPGKYQDFGSVAAVFSSGANYEQNKHEAKAHNLYTRNGQEFLA